MLCFNYTTLKIPTHLNQRVLKQKLYMQIFEGTRGWILKCEIHVRKPSTIITRWSSRGGAK